MLTLRPRYISPGAHWPPNSVLSLRLCPVVHEDRGAPLENSVPLFSRAFRHDLEVSTTIVVMDSYHDRI